MSRVLAGILAFSMSMGMIPLTAWAEGDNLALNANVESTFATKPSRNPLLVDGKIEGDANAFVGNKGTDMEITITLGQPSSFNQIKMYNAKQGKAPRSWDIAVAKNGDDWTTIAKNVTANWEYVDGKPSCKTIVVEQQENVEKIKLTIQADNQVYINELEVYNDEAEGTKLEESKTALNSLMKEAESKQEAEYTPLTYNVLQKAVEEVKLALADPLYDDLIIKNTEKIQAALDGLREMSSAHTVTAQGCAGADIYGPGEKVTIAAPYDASTQSAFVKWEITGLTEEAMKEEGIQPTQNPLIFSMPENDVTLKPIYQNQIVSSRVVQGENGKDYLEVAGVPWLYTFVQNMGRWERMGHQEQFKENSGNPDPNYPTAELPLSFLENMYEKTAHLNYSTISQALMWRDIETAPGVYDFTVVDQYVEWAKKYNMKLDLAWFGSACQEGSRIPTLSRATNGTGREVDLGYQHTAPWWYVQDENGQPIGKYYTLGAAGSVAYRLKVTGEDAEYMKQHEYYALQALFNHLADIDQDSTVISIQIENEPNSGKGGAEWTAQTQWMDYLGKAVKESRYVVATRFNFSGGGYPVNVNNLPYIDFAGPDPYKRGVGDIKNIIISGETNSTLGYIAENSGNYGNLSSLTTAAFTAGGFYGTWALDNWFCDGGGGHFNGPHSLYENIMEDYSTRYYNWKLGTIPNLTSQATDIMHYNKGMNKMGRIIAAASKEEMQSFNVEGDNPGQIYDNMKKLGNYQLGYQADDASLAIAVINGQNIYMTSDTAGSVKVKLGQKPLKVSEGEIAGDGSWAENTVKEIKRDELGVYYVELNSEECIRMEMTEAQVVEEDNLALSAVAESTNVSKNHPAENVNDGDDATGTKSNNNPTFPQYITLKWDEGKAFDTVILKGSYAQDQSPTNWDIEVSEDGEADWQAVASSGDVEWETNDGLEAKSIGFSRQTGKKGLRIKINNANLTWKTYFITELQVFDAGGKLRSLVDSIDAAPPVETDYMADLWKQFSDILSQAKELLANEQITKNEATILYVKLKQAQEDMINKNELGKVLELSRAEAEKTDVYTAESLAVLQAAIEEAQAVYNSSEMSKEEIDAQVAALKTASEALQEISEPEKPDQPGEDTGNIQVIPRPDNVMSGTLAKTEELQNILSEEDQAAIEQGAQVKVELEVSDITDRVPEEDKALTQDVLAGELAGQFIEGTYLDLLLYKTVGDSERQPVTETTGALTVQFTLPENLLNQDTALTRIYKIIRIHEWIAEILDAVLNGSILSFQTDRFSTYALVYSDVPAEQQPETPTITELKVTSPGKVEYTVGEELDRTGLAVIAVYSDGTSRDVTGEAELTGYNKDQAGEQTITVSYGGATATFQVTVKASGNKPDTGGNKPGTGTTPQPGNNGQNPGTQNPGNSDDQNPGNGTQDPGNNGQNIGNSNQTQGTGSSQTPEFKNVSASPRTGDAQNIMVFVCTMLLAAGIVVVVMMRRRRVR